MTGLRSADASIQASGWSTLQNGSSGYPTHGQVAATKIASNTVGEVIPCATAPQTLLQPY